MGLNAAHLAAEPVGFVAGALLLRLRPPVVRERGTVVLGALAVLSAVGAMGAGCSATGWAALDLVLLAAAGAAAVFAGAFASPKLLLAGSAAAAVLGSGSAALPLALAGAGLLLASLFDDEPVLNGAGAALVAQAALRLTRPGGAGLTALAAAAILVPLLAAAIPHLGPARRRLLARVAVGLAAFALVGAVTSAIAAWSAAGSLRRGLAAAGAVVTADPQSGLETAAGQLASARKDFSAARRALGAWWARPAAAVPVVAQHWRVLHAAALTGDELAATGERALRAPALADVRVSDGRVPLEQLAAIGPPVRELAQELTAGRRRLAAARSPFLLPPLLDRLDTELERIVKAERTTQSLDRALPLLPGLLGQDGPRRYFLAVQTPAEARAGGGFIGNFGEVTADDGHLSLSRFGRPAELDNAPGQNERRLLAPPDFVVRYARFAPQFLWSNVNLSPDFPTDAEVIGGLYPQSGGAPVDGVIAVDPEGLAALLRLVGPVEVAGWPAPVSADNVVQIMLHDQYVVSDRRERIDFLGEVAQETWRRLTSGQLPPPQQLLATLAPAVRTKHLLLSSTRPEEQRLFDDIGASGRVAPVRGDFLGLVTQNSSANKIDYFLRRSVDYRVELDPGSGRLRATARVTLHNDAPSSGLPGAVIGNQLMASPIPDGSNKLYLSLYTPWELLEARLDGQAVDLEKETELGRRVYSSGIVVPPMSSVTLELRLSGRLPGDPDSYRLDLYRQPVVAPDEVTTGLTVGKGWRVPGGAREWTSTRQLVADEVVDVPLRRR